MQEGCFSGCAFFEGLDLALWVSLCIAPFMPLSAATVPKASKSTVDVHVDMFEMDIIWCSSHLWHLLLHTDCLLCCDVGVLSACILCCCKAENNKLIEQEITLQIPFIFSC
jgi:hypothetical protein